MNEHFRLSLLGLVTLFAGFLCGLGTGVRFHKIDDEQARDERFLTECETAKNPFALCYLELLKAKSGATFVSAPAAASTPPAAPAAPAAPTPSATPRK